MGSIEVLHFVATRKGASVFVRHAIATAGLSLAAFISGCGGGGGGGDSGSPSNPPANLLVTPTTISVSAVSNGAAPTAQIQAEIQLTTSAGSNSNFYITGGYSHNGIASVSSSTSGSADVVTLQFQSPASLGVGSYSDTVTINGCYDQACTQQVGNSPTTVSVSYTVTAPVASAPTPTATLSANPTATAAGQPVTLTWNSSNATTCTASGAWSGNIALSGTQQVVPSTIGRNSYYLSCSGSGGEANTSVDVTASAALPLLATFPTSVAVGKPVTVRWNAPSGSSCTASGAWSGSLASSGSQTITPSSPGTLDFQIVCTAAGAPLSADAAVVVSAAPASPPATAYRINEAHDGVLKTSNGIGFPASTSPTWTRDMGAPVSYPLVVNGTVYVTTANPDQTYGSRLYALDEATGAVIWGPVAIAGTYFGSGLTYDNGRIFVLMFGGDLHAFDATTGGVLWTTQLSGYWYEASPNAYSGLVFVEGYGGLSAVDESTGNITWTNPFLGSTDWNSPAISSEGIFTETSSCNASGSVANNGATLWQVQPACSGAWAYTSVVADGMLFGRANGGLNLFDTATGTQHGQLASQFAPAVTSTAIIALNAGTLSSTRLSDLVQTWTFAGDGHLTTAPLVVNSTVLIGSSSGNVYAVDAATGLQVWVGTSPLPINSDSENGGPQPPSGPTAGENILLFEAGNSLIAWKFQ